MPDLSLLPNLCKTRFVEKLDCEVQDIAQNET